MLNINKALIFLLPLLLIACTNVPPQSQQQIHKQKIEVKEQPQTASEVEPMVNMDLGNHEISAPQAVLSLITRSQQQIKKGNLKGAKVSLERALRISPRYPNSYYYLAKVNFLDGQYTQARSMAKKSLSLGAEGNLLESILKLLGDIHDKENQ
jgi:Tfp pilus assembly protein PilF